MLTIQISTLNAPPDPTPKFSYQLCSECMPIFVIRAVPGYIPGACNGCILDAVFDLPSSTLDMSSSTSTGSASSSTTSLLASSIDTSSTLIPGLTSSQSISPSFTVTSTTGRSDAVDATTTPAVSGGGLVTVVTGTETLTETMTSTLYLPASPGNDDQFGRVVTTCYPVTTCSEFTVTLTIPPESCTTYTTTNEVNNKVETRIELVPWWTPSFQTPTQLSATESKGSVPEISGSPSPGPWEENLAKPDAGNKASPQPGAGDGLFASSGTQPHNLAPPYSDAAQSGEEVKDNGTMSDNPGSNIAAQSSEEHSFSPGSKNFDFQRESPSSVPNAPSGAAVGVGNKTSGASNDAAGSETTSAAAQAISYRARKAAATEALIVVIGVTWLLACQY